MSKHATKQVWRLCEHCKRVIRYSQSGVQPRPGLFFHTDCYEEHLEAMAERAGIKGGQGRTNADVAADAEAIMYLLIGAATLIAIGIIISLCT